MKTWICGISPPHSIHIFLKCLQANGAVPFGKTPLPRLVSAIPSISAGRASPALDVLDDRVMAGRSTGRWNSRASYVGPTQYSSESMFFSSFSGAVMSCEAIFAYSSTCYLYLFVWRIFQGTSLDQISQRRQAARWRLSPCSMIGAACPLKICLGRP